MITRLISLATLFAAGSILPAATPTLGAREVTPATMAPLQDGLPQTSEDGRCGGRRCARIPRCARRCAGIPRCARRCASVPRCSHLSGTVAGPQS